MRTLADKIRQRQIAQTFRVTGALRIHSLAAGVLVAPLICFCPSVVASALPGDGTNWVQSGSARVETLVVTQGDSTRIRFRMDVTPTEDPGQLRVAVGAFDAFTSRRSGARPEPLSTPFRERILLLPFRVTRWGEYIGLDGPLPEQLSERVDDLPRPLWDAVTTEFILWSSALDGPDEGSLDALCSDLAERYWERWFGLSAPRSAPAGTWTHSVRMDGGFALLGPILRMDGSFYQTRETGTGTGLVIRFESALAGARLLESLTLPEMDPDDDWMEFLSTTSVAFAYEIRLDSATRLPGLVESVTHWTAGAADGLGRSPSHEVRVQDIFVWD